MIKILSAEQTRQADNFTIDHEPILSIDLMERASLAFVSWFISKFSPVHSVHIVCGTGNNGGDGLAVARMLSEKTYRVHTYVVGDPQSGSEDFKVNFDRTGPVHLIKGTNDLPKAQQNDIIVDAIFGSGLSRPVTGVHQQAVEALNAAASVKIAIDIPSGLMADGPSKGAIFQADYTVSFQQPKLAFFFPENGRYVGDWNIVDIGLDKHFINQQVSSHFALSPPDVKRLLKARSKYDHKGTFGKALIAAGSYGKMGAAVLAARAAMRSGTGLLTLYTPVCGYQIIQTAVPEAMVITDAHERELSESPLLSGYDAVGIGPGIGKSALTLNSMGKLLKLAEVPLVIDADGLNLIAENRELLQILPQGSILTPHPAEFKRLVGHWHDDFERLEIQKAFSKEYGVIVLLKGAHSSVTVPSGEVYFNMTGNPGMATGGSGDVLTGMITALLAQGYTPEISCMAAVFVHGLAGDIAAEEKGQISLIASDIVEKIPEAFKKITDKTSEL